MNSRSHNLTRRAFLLAGSAAATASSLGVRIPTGADASGGDSKERVAICLPYPGASKSAEAWATQERQVDWWQPNLEAERCSVCFAAVELRNFLSRTLDNHEVFFTDQLPASGPAVVLGTAARLRSHFSLSPSEGERGPSPQVRIESQVSASGRYLLLCGADRVSTLHAAYVYLEELGWRWYSPAPHGEIAPGKRSELPLDGFRISSSSDFELRGFQIPVPSPSLFLWMARNRLNYANVEYVPDYFLPLMKKLGFFVEVGGHVTPRILNPDRRLTSGKTMFEEHPDWYAEVEGKRERKNAHRYQYCVSNVRANAFVAEGVVDDLATDFPRADRYNFMLYDTWRGWCECANCKALGSDSDRYLHVMSHIRKAIDNAHRTGRIPHNIPLSLGAYEGTPSLHGPSKPIADSLKGRGAVSVIFFPINRCYAHAMEDPACTEFNARYRRGLASWEPTARDIPVTVCEYYGVSKWEDLPIVFADSIARDLPYYRHQGVKGFSFMHVPVDAWGARTLDYLLIARLAWSTETNTARLRQEFFECYYEAAAPKMREFHEQLALAYSNIAAWRAWDSNSVLSKLLRWTKGKPETPLFSLRHLQPKSHSGNRDQGIGPEESLKILDSCRSSIAEALRMSVPTAVNARIAEDARLFRYGDDAFRLLWSVAQIYEWERQGQPDRARQEWSQARQWAVSLDSYYVPHGYDYPERFEDLPTGPVGPRIKDGLTRTQLRPLVQRLRNVYEA